MKNTHPTHHQGTSKIAFEPFHPHLKHHQAFSSLWLSRRSRAFWSFQKCFRIYLAGYIVYRPIHRRNIPVRTTNRTRPLTPSCYTLSYSYEKATNSIATNCTNKYSNDMQQTNKRTAEQTENWSNPVTTLCQCVIPSFRESLVSHPNVRRWAPHSGLPSECCKELQRAQHQRRHGSHTKQAVLRINRKFLTLADSLTEKNVCRNRFTSSKQNYDVPVRHPPKKIQRSEVQKSNRDE